eukprot:m51a1_g1794 hypothetical protein (996) ;mRNA; r:407384-413554
MGRKKPSSAAPAKPAERPNAWALAVGGPGDVTPRVVALAFGVQGRAACAKKTHPRGNCASDVLCLRGLRAPARDEAVGAGDCAAAAACRSGPVAGLVNKGATCYMNSLLQALYALTPFRDGVFRWRPPPGSSEEEQRLCSELQKLFVAMQATKQPSLDPADMFFSLRVDRSLQQDVQEFYKLFVSHLEDHYRACTDPKVSSLIPDLFQGKSEYRTTCKGCQSVSAVVNTFGEIDINIDTTERVEDCVAEYIRPEELTGSNQYLCSSCGRRCDASRQIALVSLPPVLNMQLLRFQYDMQTMARKKVRTAVSFPFELDMSPYVADRPPGPLLYDLRAVLIHKGPSASGGHYVCHAKPDAGPWYEADDTAIRDLQLDSIGHSGDEETRSKKPSKANRKPSQPEAAPEPPARAVSKGAYMLIYVRRGTPAVEPAPAPELVAEVARANEVFEETAREALAARRAAEDEYDERMQLKDAAVRATEELSQQRPLCGEALREYYWLSSEWWERLCTGESSPGPVDNSKVLCAHGKVSPEHTEAVKCVAGPAWKALLRRYGGGPELCAGTASCAVCVAEHCARIRESDSGDQERARVKAMISEDKNPSPEQSVWVSSDWLQTWMKKPDKLETFNMSEAITCDHGALVTDAAQRRLLSVEALSYLVAEGFEAEPLFNGKEEPCPQCQIEESEEKMERAKQKPLKAEEKKLFNEFLTVCHPLTKPGAFHIVSDEWYAAWKQWVTDAQSTQRPGKVGCQALVCEHGKLAVDPAHAAALEQDAQPLRLCSDQQWKGLAERYGVAGEFEWVKEPDKPAVVLPGCCVSCADKARRELVEKETTYESGQIYVVRGDGKEQQQQTAPQPQAEADLHNYNLRQRGGGAKEGKMKKVLVKDVSSAWAVHALKLHLFANYKGELRCPPPYQQVLRWQGRVLADDDTLHDCGVVERGLVFLEVVEVPSDAAIVIEDSVASSAQQRREQAFEGTALSSRPAAAAAAAAAAATAASPI